MSQNLKVSFILNADAEVLQRELQRAQEGLHGMGRAAQAASQASAGAVQRLRDRLKGVSDDIFTLQTIATKFRMVKGYMYCLSSRSRTRQNG